MKKKRKHILQSILVNKLSYALFTPFIFIADRLKASRADYITKPAYTRLEKSVEEIFHTKTVLHGPFKGMQYAGERTEGSSYYAKWLGSYEKETHPFIYKTFNRVYKSIVNIGCDDGYYSTGMALHFKDVPVYAYDSNPKALILTRQLARANAVESQLHFGRRYTNATANSFDKSRSLFIVDCEGDEIMIFTKGNAANFEESDLIIELHLQLYPEALFYFKELFSQTHNIEIIDSIPDHLKAMHYDYPEIKDLDYKTRHFITEEREIFMQWIFLSSKNHNG
jgi:hypothetical protein